MAIKPEKVYVRVLVPRKDLEVLKAVAAAENRSLSNWASWVLRREARALAKLKR